MILSDLMGITKTIQVIYKNSLICYAMKIDPYNHKENFLGWKAESQKGISGLSKANSELILKYLNDMERGINVATGSIKGSRSYSRLICLRNRLFFFSKKFKEVYSLDDITKINEEQLLSFFSDMRNGQMKRGDGKDYMGSADYIKIFKAFWHWHQKTKRKEGIEVPDITIDLDVSRDKPKWVYLTEKQVKKMCDNAKYEYKILIMFLFDTGIRAPTELMNVKVSDLYNDCKELNIREETSKTFGRRIKLLLCPDLIREYIQNKDLGKDDYLFKISPPIANQYIKRLALKSFGNGESEAGGKYSEISLYDFRHISCCYWLPRYKSESALKYRFGWKKSDKIHYYSELLGMKDTISEDDLLVDVTKTEIEKKLVQAEKDRGIMQERVSQMEEQVKAMKELIIMVENKIKMVEMTNGKAR